MNFKTIRILISALLVLYVGISKAQNEYRSEIGVLGGGSFYLGDANRQLFANNQTSFSLIYRQKLDTRIAFSGTWNKTTVVGSNAGVSFNNPVQAVDLCGEFNFFDYDDKIYKPNSKKHSLYIFAGIGGMFFNYNSGNSFMFSYPVGLGYKIMLGERFHLNFILAQRLLLTDKMEGTSALNNVNKLNGSNIFNNDMLTTFSVGLTYNIWKKGCKCQQMKL